jgi:hypothetical protein
MKQARECVADMYNRHRIEHSFNFGDRVKFRRNVISSKPLKPSSKLMLSWSDPVVIAKFVRPNILLLANPDNGVNINRAHVSRLKSYVS